MSKIDDDWYNLPPLQKRIVLSLAQKGPQTRNKLAEETGSEWKNVRFALRSLVQKMGLVQELTKKKYYLGQRFPTFWLTGIGIAYALLHGSDPTVILTHIKSSYPQEEEMRLIVSLTQVLGKKTLSLALRMVLSYPLEEAIGKISVMGLLEAKKFTSKDSKTLVRETMKALEPYPKYYNKHFKIWQDISELSEEVVKTKKRKNL